MNCFLSLLLAKKRPKRQEHSPVFKIEEPEVYNHVNNNSSYTPESIHITAQISYISLNSSIFQENTTFTLFQNLSHIIIQSVWKSACHDTVFKSPVRWIVCPNWLQNFWHGDTFLWYRLGQGILQWKWLILPEEQTRDSCERDSWR